MLTNPTQVINDLRHAIEYLDTHGWVQGYDFDGKGGCCAFGAIRGVVGDDNPEFVSALTRDRAADAARAFYRVHGQDIVTYNDEDGQTKAQVIAALAATADAIERDPSRA